MGNSGIIWRIALTGGEPEAFTSKMEGVDLRYADALPDGRGVLLTVNRGNDLLQSSIAVVGPQGGEVRELFRGAMARYAESGHIVYTTADGTLMAAPFDLRSLQVTGSSVVMLEGVMVKRGSASQFTLSETGTLAYVEGETTDLTLAWYDRQGRATRLQLPPASYSRPRLSPDGAHLLVNVHGRDLTSINLETGSRMQLGEAPTDLVGVWTPDGSRVVISRWDGTSSRPFVQAADGSRSPQPVGGGEIAGWVNSISLDGVLLLDEFGANRSDLLAVSLDGEEVTPPTDTPASERGGMFSPDGRFIAYSSNASGEWEVYVQPYPGFDSGKWTVSAGGGRLPMWSQDGTELFYIQENRSMMSVKVTTAPTFRAERPEMLFEGDFSLWGGGDQSYDVAADGRFLMIQQPSYRADVFVVQNFFEELKRQVGN